jgi:hypothetical protein
MARTLAGVTLPGPTQSTRETAWVQARFRYLDGTEPRQVLANLRRFRLSYKATAAQITALRTLFYKTSPLRYIDDTLTVDCYVFTTGVFRVSYLPYRPAGGIVASVELELTEHGAAYAGASTTLTEPAAGVSASWSLGGSAIASPSGYIVEYAKQSVVHQLANGTVWVDSTGVSRAWQLRYPAMLLAAADVFRAAQATKSAVEFLSPTDEDSASAYVYVSGLPETVVLGTSNGRVEATIRLEEGPSGGASTPACQVLIDLNNDGDYGDAGEDITAYVAGWSLDRQATSREAGPSGVGGGISHQATISLRHAGGLFSPFNAGSRLASFFYGKPIQIKAGPSGSLSPVFTGRILSTGEEIGSRKASIVARDLGAFLLQHKRGDTTLYQNTASHTYLAAILAAAGMTPGAGAGQYTLDNGNYAPEFAWMDRETYAAECDQVAAMEGGRVYWDMAGCFHFENSAHLLAEPNAETLTVASMADLRVGWDVDNIANRVVVECTKRYLAVQQTIWQAQEVYRVPAEIEGGGAVAAGSTATVINLTTSGSYGADALKGEWLYLAVGFYTYRKIKSNAATTGGMVTAVTVETAFSGAPGAGVVYYLGGMLEVEAQFNYPAAGVVTPVAWTKALQDANADFDYQAQTGGGQDATSSLAVQATAYAASAKILLYNSSSQAVYMQRMRLRGNPLLARETRRAEEYDQASIDTYGERDPLRLSGDASNVYVQNEIQARSVAQMLLGRFNEPHAVVSLPGLPGLKTREIGQRITITEITHSGINSEWFIIGIADQWGANGIWTQDVTAVEAAMLGATSDSGIDWFKIGTSKYGTGAGHGHLYW